MKKFVPVPIIFLLFMLTSIAFAHYEHFKIPTATITIDGNMDDWNNIEPVYVDDINDEDPDANYEGTDLYKFYLAKDDTFLYLMMTLYDGAPKTDMFTLYGFHARQKSDYSTTIGDYLIFAAFNDGKWTASTQKAISSTGPDYFEDITGYPSKYVGVGSNFIEWKVYLSDFETLNGRFVRTSIHPQVPGEGDKYPASDDDTTLIHLIDDTTTATPTPTPSPSTGTGIIYGTVTDDEGFPFKNVSVSMIGGNGYSKTAETDEEGYYEFTDLAAGDYTLTYEKDGYQTKTQEVSLEEGETLELEIIVMEQAEKGSISGYVTNIYGDPIESVKLKLKGIRTKAIKMESTDADGFFEFTDLGTDDYMITVTKKRYKSARKTVTIEEGEATEIEIELRKTTKRRGISLLIRGK